MGVYNQHTLPKYMLIFSLTKTYEQGKMFPMVSIYIRQYLGSVF